MWTVKHSAYSIQLNTDPRSGTLADDSAAGNKHRLNVVPFYTGLYRLRKNRIVCLFSFSIHLPVIPFSAK